MATDFEADTEVIHNTLSDPNENEGLSTGGEYKAGDYTVCDKGGFGEEMGIQVFLLGPDDGFGSTVPLVGDEEGIANLITVAMFGSIIGTYTGPSDPFGGFFSALELNIPLAGPFTSPADNSPGDVELHAEGDLNNSHEGEPMPDRDSEQVLFNVTDGFTDLGLAAALISGNLINQLTSINFYEVLIGWSGFYVDISTYTLTITGVIDGSGFQPLPSDLPDTPAIDMPGTDGIYYRVNATGAWIAITTSPGAVGPVNIGPLNKDDTVEFLGMPFTSFETPGDANGVSALNINAAGAYLTRGPERASIISTTSYAVASQQG